MPEEVLAVLTAKSAKTCLDAGGTQSWVLDRAHTKRCRYAVLCQNAGTDWGDGTEAHGTAFMVGRIKDVVPSTETEGRWLVTFDQYAPISVPNVWRGWRNPVRYTTFQELGVDLEGVRFEPMPPGAEPPGAAEAPAAAAAKPTTMLTIAEAKKALAATFGVAPEAVEITIRG